jgi:hypothetical protein
MMRSFKSAVYTSEPDTATRLPTNPLDNTYYFNQDLNAVFKAPIEIKLNVNNNRCKSL